MAEKRIVSIDRRKTTRSGRRTTDPAPISIGQAVRTSATLLWELPDGTRGWIMRHRKQIIAHVSRNDLDLQIEIFDDESEARQCAEKWRVDFLDAGV